MTRKLEGGAAEPVFIVRADNEEVDATYPLPVSINGTPITPANPIPVDANLQVGGVDVGTTNPVPSADVLLEGGLTVLIGPDDQVDQDEYSNSVGIAVVDAGEILGITLYATKTGTGAVLTPNGILYIFDTDPTITAGASAMSLAERLTVIGQVAVQVSDWTVDANGASTYIFDQPVAFHNVSTLYFAWFHQDSTSFNDAAGDDESMRVNFWYKRYDG